MKVLFAVGKDQWSKTASERYYEKYGDTLEYKNVFYFKALIDEVRKNKTYDRIVIHEDLEQFKAKDIEQIDRKLYSYIDTITDEIQDSEIIYICSERRTKDDEFVRLLYNLGIYNLLIGDDRNINPLCDIIRKPKTKREAKEYLNINSSSITETGSITRDDEVDEKDMMNILNYYERIKDKPEEYLPAFEQIAEQYTRAQLKVIACSLPKRVKEKIYAEPRFKFLLGNNVQALQQQQSQEVKNNTNENSNSKYTRGIMDIFKGKFKNKTKAEHNKNQEDVKKVDENKEFADRVRKEAEAEADRQQEFAEQARREAEEKMQREAIERAKNETNPNAENHQQFAEKAKREAEAEADRQQELAEKARKEAEERMQRELAERAKKEAEAKEQRELAEKARREEEEANRQKEIAEEIQKENEKIKNSIEDIDIIIDEEISKINVNSNDSMSQTNTIELKAKEEELARKQAEQAMLEARAREEGLAKKQAEQNNERANVINAGLTQTADFSLEERGVREEAKRLAEEQEKIRRAQAELEEEKRKFREEQARIAQEKNHIENVQNIQTNVTYEAIPVVARDYKKLVVFVGANKAGTSFMVNAVANQLSNSKVVTSILDMTRDKGMYYIYNQSDKTLRKIASECMQNLSNSQDSYLPVSKYLKVYTTVPGSVSDSRRGYKHKAIIDIVKNNSNITIVDADFTTPIDYFESASEIYVIQDMDILKMQETTAFLREMKNRNMDMRKIKIIINKYVKSILTPKKIIEGISYYKDPEMTFTDVLLNNKVLYSVVPYNINNYTKYIESLCKENMNFKGYTTDFLEAINEISEQVYPRNGVMKKKNGLFR